MKCLKYLALFIVVCFSCNTNEVSFDNSDFKNTFKLSSELVVHPDDSGDRIDFRFISDSLILITTNGDSGKFIELYDFKKSEVITRMLDKGTKRDEFGNVIVKEMNYNNNKELFFMDILSNTFLFLENDSIFGLKNHLIEKKESPVPFISESIVKLGENKFLTANSSYSDYKEFRNPNEKPLIVFTTKDSLQKNDIDNPILKAKYFVANINSSMLISDNGKKYIWKIDKMSDNIYIYDFNSLKLRKNLQGPYFLPVSYKAKEENNSKSFVVYDSGKHSSYVDFALTDTSVFLLYTSKRFDDFNEYKKKRDTLAFKSELLEFSWDGKPINRYILDFEAKSVSIDRQGNFYCTVKRNYSDKPWFVKYAINKKIG